jgi:hypothetical protein
VDLLFEPSTDLAAGFLYSIKSDLEDSNFPYKVELVERAQVAASYKDRIEAEKVLL